MNVNFPVPPALQLLQNLLQRATDREAREGGAGGRGAGQEEEEEEEEQQQPAQPRTCMWLRFVPPGNCASEVDLVVYTLYVLCSKNGTCPLYCIDASSSLPLHFVFSTCSV